MNTAVSGSANEEMVASSSRWSVRRRHDVSECEDDAMAVDGVNKEFDLDMDVESMDGDIVCEPENTNCECLCNCV